MKLSPFELWMVESNLKTIREGEKAEVIIATLKANGYPKIAKAVEQRLNQS